MSIRSIWSILSFKSIFFLIDLFVDERGSMKFSTLITSLLVSPFRSVSNCFIHLCAPTAIDFMPWDLSSSINLFNKVVAPYVELFLRSVFDLCSDSQMAPLNCLIS